MRYLVREHFRAERGEGTFAGRTAYFIHMADVYPPERAPEYAKTPEQVAALVKAPRGGIVVLSAPEHRLCYLDAAITAIKSRGDWPIHVDSWGHHPLPLYADWLAVAVAPRHRPPLEENVARADEFRVYVDSKYSLVAGLQACANRKRGAIVILSPTGDASDDPHVRRLILEAVKKTPNVWASEAVLVGCL
ncbi:hypothetical protein D3C72_993220 [compost metagenome]